MLQEPWYYRIEVEPDAFTPGVDRGNLAVCRDLLTRIDLKGKRCLDIGTQEFIAPILMHHQGAAEIVAYDRLQKQRYLDFLKPIYGFVANYFGGISLLHLKKAMQTRGISPAFDFVNFSGVLYHMVDPLSGVAQARAFLREGGIMLLETAVSFRDGWKVDFNAEGELYGMSSNYFLPTLAVMDYWVRMMRMKVINATFWGSDENQIGRCALILRGMGEVQAEPRDKWMRKQWIENDFQMFGLRYPDLASRETPIEYRGAPSNQEKHPGTDSVTLASAYKNKPTYAWDKDLTALKLAHVGK